MTNYTTDLNYILNYYNKVRLNKDCILAIKDKLFFNPKYSIFYKNLQQTQISTNFYLLKYLILPPKPEKRKSSWY